MSHNRFTTGADVYRDVVGARSIRCGDGGCKVRSAEGLRCVLAEVHVYLGTSHLHRETVDGQAVLTAWRKNDHE